MVDPEAVQVRHIDAGRMYGRWEDAVVLVRIETFEEVPADEVGEVRVTYPLTKAMGTVWVVWGYSGSD